MIESGAYQNKLRSNLYAPRAESRRERGVPEKRKAFRLQICPYKYAYKYAYKYGGSEMVSKWIENGFLNGVV